jgi:uncharacterized cupredoxin-like copper-binding protein
MQNRWTILLALGMAVAACTPSAERAELTIVATDFAYTPSTLEVRDGQPVHLRLQNDGSLEHDLSLSGLPIAEGSVAATPESGHDMSHLHTDAALSVHLSAQPGQTASVSFTPTEPGSYRFICTIPGHQEAGMFGTLMVTEP